MSKENNVFIAILQRIERKLDKLNNQSNLTNKDYLTTREACAFLGCQRTMVWKYVKDGKLTKLKLENGRTYYHKNELQAIIESGLPVHVA